MRAALLALVLAGCFSPTLQDGLPCTDQDHCPDGLSCVPGVHICTADPPAQARFTTISAGDNHACGIDSDHALYCWGLDSEGQGGVVGESWLARPTRVGTGFDWDKVYAGFGVTCAIKTDHSLWCFGGFAGSTDPVEVGAGTRWQSATMGEYGWCAFDADSGEASCGQDINIAPFQQGTSWTSFATNGTDYCGVTDGKLYCWGANQNGEDGDGSMNPVNAPREVVPGQTWESVTMGFAHTCAVRSDQTLWCWGANDSGQCGIDGDGAQLDPVQVMGVDHVATVSALWYTTCANDTDGRAWCWGQGGDGEVGAGGPAYRMPDPLLLSNLALTTISSGATLSCGLDPDGGAWCWGDNTLGQLGTGTIGQNPDPVQIVSAQSWEAIAIGYRHTCGISEGDLWCWGRNGDGELGDGTTRQQPFPERIDSTQDWEHVAASFNHTCALAAGQLFCWGNNSAGQLGLGDTENRLTPTQLIGGSTWTGVGVAYGLTCATNQSGELWCWGDNVLDPQMVDAGPGWSDPDGSSETEADTMTAVKDGTTFTVNTQEANIQLTAFTDWTRFDDASSHGCGLRVGGQLWCQGDSNDYGELGNPGATEATAGIRVGTDSDWAAVASGAFFSCGLRGDALYCWGRDDIGQLGDGGGSDKQTAPVPSTKPNGWTTIAGGAWEACGIQSDQTLWCWGEDHRIAGGWDVPVWVAAP